MVEESQTDLGTSGQGEMKTSVWFLTVVEKPAMRGDIQHARGWQTDEVPASTAAIIQIAKERDIE
jgi:hypothetical protein